MGDRSDNITLILVTELEELEWIKLAQNWV
jgi:hypothetical protein